MLRAPMLRADAHKLSGVGFKILLDILATVDEPVRIKEFPLEFAARAEGESKLDLAVVFEFLVGLYDKWLGDIIPTRFALFGTIGAVGVLVHMAVLSAWLAVFGGDLQGHLVSAFEIGQTLAALVAMTFNFVLNNSLTYADKRLAGAAALLRGWLQIRPDLFCRPAGQCRIGRGPGALGRACLSGGAGRDRDRIGVELCAVEPLCLGPFLAEPPWNHRRDGCVNLTYRPRNSRSPA